MRTRSSRSQTYVLCRRLSTTIPRRAPFKCESSCAFAALALLLAGIGIHGLLSFTVSTRSPEIAVRMALGAQPGNILGIVLRESFLLAGAGVILGVALAYIAGRAMQALLAGLNPADASTFLIAAALCFLMTLAGSLAPSLRALRVDAITALRSE